MPSDARVTMVVDAFAVLFAQYRSAVAATLEDVRGCLTSHSSTATGRTAQLTTELGEFAAGRIDAARLSALLGDPAQLLPAGVERLDRAGATLREIAARGETLMHLQLAPGADLTSAVRARLAEIGRAFGAARVGGSQSTSTPITAEEVSILGALPFRDWTAAERRLAPPLIVSLDGSDLHPAGLGECLDGLQKIVLIVDGDAPPASLVRLITPGVFVAQSADPSICRQVVEWLGPAIAAIVPASCAQFVHDPSAGPELWQRVKLQHVPAAAPGARIGGLTTAQQVEELQQLEALAHRPVSGFASGGGATAADPVDRVAAWLLRQANLVEPVGGD